MSFDDFGQEILGIEYGLWIGKTVIKSDKVWDL